MTAKTVRYIWARKSRDKIPEARPDRENKTPKRRATSPFHVTRHASSVVSRHGSALIAVLEVGRQAVYMVRRSQHMDKGI